MEETPRNPLSQALFSLFSCGVLGVVAVPLVVASESSDLSVGLLGGIYSRLCYAFIYFELGWVHFPGLGSVYS